MNQESCASLLLFLDDIRSRIQELNLDTELELVRSARPDIARCDSRLVQIEHDLKLITIGIDGRDVGGRGDGHARNGIDAALVKQGNCIVTAARADEIVQRDLVGDSVLKVGREGLVDEVPIQRLSGRLRGKEGSGDA